MNTFGAEFIRVSSFAQDESSQVRENDEYAAAHGITIVKRFVLHGYSASKGMQVPELQEVISDMERGEYSVLLVTDSSRLDRREDLDAQAEILLAIRRAGGEVISITEPQFGKQDFVGRIVTLVAQQGNAEKSRKVKDTTFRGIRSVAENQAHHGSLPVFWAAEGPKYKKQAYCTDPRKVAEIYERVAKGDSISAIGRECDLYAGAIKRLIRFPANHTGVIVCAYTHDIRGKVEWAHQVKPVVDSPLWWRANKVLDANMTEARANKGGRPVAGPANWISGVLRCPACGGRLFLNVHRNEAGLRRTPKLRCSGVGKRRLACGQFKGVDARPVIDAVARIFENDSTDILSFQRIAGNAHELEELKAKRSEITARLSVTEDDDALDALIAERKALKARIDAFVIEPDKFDYDRAGMTVAQMWNDGDDAVRRGMAIAVRDAWGMALVEEQGEWRVAIGTAGSGGTGDANGIVDLGNGLCFRRQ